MIGGILSTLQNLRGGFCPPFHKLQGVLCPPCKKHEGCFVHLCQNEQGVFCPGGVLSYIQISLFFYCLTLKLCIWYLIMTKRCKGLAIQKTDLHHGPTCTIYNTNLGN